MMRAKNRRGLVLLVFKLAVSLCFAGYVLRKIDLALLRAHISGADPLQLAWAAVTLIAGGCAGAAVWLPVLKSKRYAVDYRGAAAMYWSGMFFNSFLPSTIGGDFCKGYQLVKGCGGGAGLAAVTILLDRLISFSVLIMIGILAFCISFGYYLAAALAAAGFLLTVRLVHGLARKERVSEATRLAGFLLALALFFRDYRRCAAAFAAALLAQGLKISCHIFLIRALGLDLAVSSVWYVIPVFGVVSVLPISFGGIGIRETAALAIAGPLAIVAEELVALSLASHLLYVTVNCLGLIPFVLMRRGAA